MTAMPVPPFIDPLSDLVSEGQCLVDGEIWDEIAGEAIVMRTLPWPRFCGSTGEKLVLPERMAVALEDFEVGLRVAGLIADTQGLCQTFRDGAKYRVKTMHIPDDFEGHVIDPSSPALLTPLARAVRRRRRRQF